MPRLILITVLLILCSCAPVRRFVFSSTTPMKPSKVTAEDLRAFSDKLEKRSEEWPVKFLALLLNPDWGDSVHAWRKPDAVEMGQSGEFTFSWRKEDVSYPPSSSSWHSIHDRSGNRVGSYEVPAAPAAPIRTLDCEIILTFGEVDGETLITNARYAGPYCYIYFPLP